jgi:HK97 family phage portal protein
LRHPSRIGVEGVAALAQSWRDVHAGPLNSNKVAVLEEGMSFEALSMTLEDAELLSSRKFQTEEIARLLGIPLPLLQVWDHSTFTNSDTASQWFASLTLAPICRKIELEAGRVLFNDPAFHLEIDLSALERGSFQSRIQAEIALVRSGILTANEVRLAEGWPAMEGGDKLQPQAIGGRPPNVGPVNEGDTQPPPGGPMPNGSEAVH